MKKIFYLLCIIFAAIGCGKDLNTENEKTDAENADGIYTFNLTLEDSVKSKANVLLLRYVLEVYEGSLSAMPTRYIGSTNIFNVPMKRGVDYICLFWGDDGTSYNVEDLKAVSQINENVPAGPAFCAKKIVNLSNFDASVTLKRAVAEVSFIESVGAPSMPNNLVVTYPFGRTTLNVGDGSVSRTPGSTVRTISGNTAYVPNSVLATDYLLAPVVKEEISGIKFQLNSLPEKVLAKTTIQGNYKTKITGSYFGESPANMSLMIGGVKFDFTLVKAGTFQMGRIATDPNMDASSNILTWVKISKDYYIGTTEVTQEQWQVVMGTNPSKFQTPFAPDFNTNNCPVETISWLSICGGTDGTTATVPLENCFLTKINALMNKNFRLPTRAEWEYAARGGHRITTRTDFPGTSTNLVEYAWYATNSNSRTHKVAGKQPNVLGIFDMGGNVAELTSTYSEGSRAVGTVESPIVDPQGPATGSYLYTCGSNWNKAPNYLYTFNAVTLRTSSADEYTGFRLVFVP